MTTITERAYIAGLFDGEGCISFRYQNKRNLTPSVSVVNNCKDIIDYLMAKYGGNIYKRFSKKKEHSDSYIWQPTTNAGRLLFIQDILPFLKIKRLQGELLLEFLESRTKRNMRRGFHLPYNDREKQIVDSIRQATSRYSKRGGLGSCLQ